LRFLITPLSLKKILWRQAGGPPAMLAAGELLVGELGMDLYADA
jgi:hypothetical protein